MIVLDKNLSIYMGILFLVILWTFKCISDLITFILNICYRIVKIQL